MTILQKIEEIEILQIICTGKGTIEEARELHAIKSELLNQYYNDQLLAYVEQLIQPKSFIKKLFRL